MGSRAQALRLTSNAASLTVRPTPPAFTCLSLSPWAYPSAYHSPAMLFSKVKFSADASSSNSQSYKRPTTPTTSIDSNRFVRALSTRVIQCRSVRPLISLLLLAVRHTYIPLRCLPTLLVVKLVTRVTRKHLVALFVILTQERRFPETHVAWSFTRVPSITLIVLSPTS